MQGAGLHIVLFFFICVLSLANSEQISGFEFGDNLATKYLTSENGVAEVRTKEHYKIWASSIIIIVCEADLYILMLLVS